MKYLLLFAFYIITPAIVIHYSGKYLLLRKAGNIILVYILGLLVANLGLLPDLSNIGEDHPGLVSFAGLLGAKPDSPFIIQHIITSISIPLALPLLLMTLDFSSWTRMAGRTFWGMITGMISVVLVVIVGNYIFKSIIPDTWKVSGLLIGVYTGGTPNLASIKTMLNVDATTYLLIHSSDLLFSGAYLLFLMTIGKVLFKRFLPSSYSYGGSFVPGASVISETEDYTGFFEWHNLMPTLKALGASVLIFAIGGGISMLVPKDYSMVTAILSITALGIGSSFIPELRRSPKTYEMGMYLIMVFSLAVASLAEFKTFTAEAIPIFLYVSYAITFSLILHVLLSRLFKVDADTMMISSTALICSPPFVPVIAGTLNNRKIIISGLTVGIVGYAIGNFLGVFVAYLLK